jgi:hypothetical protein
MVMIDIKTEKALEAILEQMVQVVDPELRGECPALFIGGRALENIESCRLFLNNMFSKLTNRTT